MTAHSTRLLEMMPTLSPRPMPSVARPPRISSTILPNWAYVMYRHSSPVFVPKTSRELYLLTLLVRTSTSETIDWGSVIGGGLHYHFAATRKHVQGLWRLWGKRLASFWSRFRMPPAIPSGSIMPSYTVKTFGCQMNVHDS